MSENGERAISGQAEDKGAETKVSSTLGIEGELPCLIVYSEREHVDYIYPMLSLIENVLRDKGFKPLRLGDEIRSGEDYLEKLETLIEDCILGVVIFDGFRANVLFEFGFLKGRNKPTILLQSRDAYVSVRTLYETQKISGLGEEEFGRLKNPPINHPLHFSDFSGKHIAHFKWNAREDEPLHPSTVLEKELKKNSEATVEEVKRVKTRTLPKLESTPLKEFSKPLMRVIKFYTGAEKIDMANFKTAYDELITVAQKYGFKLPYDLSVMAAATCLLKAEEIDWRNVEERIDCFNFSINIYQEILASVSSEKDPHEYSDVQKKIGDVYYELSNYQEKNVNCKEAINAYEKALKVYMFERFPMQYAMTQNNLGAAYRTLAEVEAKADNCKKAIGAYTEALKVRTFERFPMDYAMTQNNLGNAYSTLAEVEAKAGNCKKAIGAYTEALKVYTFERFPMQYAMTQNNLGAAYRTLAEVEAKADNCKKAIGAYTEALKVYTFERFPMQYAMTQNNLGAAYSTLAEVEAKADNCTKAIGAYTEALKVRTFERFPIDYAMTQNNLGNAYSTLADVKDKAKNCKKAIKACEEALKVFTKEDFPEVYPLVERNLRGLLKFCD